MYRLHVVSRLNAGAVKQHLGWGALEERLNCQHADRSSTSTCYFRTVEQATNLTCLRIAHRYNTVNRRQIEGGIAWVDVYKFMYPYISCRGGHTQKYTFSHWDYHPFRAADLALG